MQAVQILLVFRERLNTAESQGGSLKVDNSMTEALLQVDPIQVSSDLSEIITKLNLSGKMPSQMLVWLIICM